jgi:hypothetical protein
MSAAKTHTVKLLDKKGLFPLSSFVKVDPDHIRVQLPECDAYARCHNAGYLTWKESG